MDPNTDPTNQNNPHQLMNVWGSSKPNVNFQNASGTHIAVLYGSENPEKLKSQLNRSITDLPNMSDKLGDMDPHARMTMVTGSLKSIYEGAPKTPFKPTATTIVPSPAKGTKHYMWNTMGYPTPESGTSVGLLGCPNTLTAIDACTEVRATPCLPLGADIGDLYMSPSAHLPFNGVHWYCQDANGKVPGRRMLNSFIETNGFKTTLVDLEKVLSNDCKSKIPPLYLSPMYVLQWLGEEALKENKGCISNRTPFELLQHCEGLEGGAIIEACPITCTKVSDSRVEYWLLVRPNTEKDVHTFKVPQVEAIIRVVAAKKERAPYFSFKAHMVEEPFQLDSLSEQLITAELSTENINDLGHGNSRKRNTILKAIRQGLVSQRSSATQWEDLTHPGLYGALKTECLNKVKQSPNCANPLLVTESDPEFRSMCELLNMVMERVHKEMNPSYRPDVPSDSSDTIESEDTESSDSAPLDVQQTQPAPEEMDEDGQEEDSDASSEASEEEEAGDDTESEDSDDSEKRAWSPLTKYMAALATVTCHDQRPLREEMVKELMQLLYKCAVLTLENTHWDNKYFKRLCTPRMTTRKFTDTLDFDIEEGEEEVIAAAKSILSKWATIKVKPSPLALGLTSIYKSFDGTVMDFTGGKEKSHNRWIMILQGKVHPLLDWVRPSIEDIIPTWRCAMSHSEHRHQTAKVQVFAQRHMEAPGMEHALTLKESIRETKQIQKQYISENGESELKFMIAKGAAKLCDNLLGTLADQLATTQLRLEGAKRVEEVAEQRVTEAEEAKEQASNAVEERRSEFNEKLKRIKEMSEKDILTEDDEKEMTEIERQMKSIKELLKPLRAKRSKTTEEHAAAVEQHQDASAATNEAQRQVDQQEKVVNQLENPDRVREMAKEQERRERAQQLLKQTCDSDDEEEGEEGEAATGGKRGREGAGAGAGTDSPNKKPRIDRTGVPHRVVEYIQQRLSDQTPDADTLRTRTIAQWKEDIAGLATVLDRGLFEGVKWVGPTKPRTTGKITDKVIREDLIVMQHKWPRNVCITDIAKAFENYSEDDMASMS